MRLNKKGIALAQVLMVTVVLAGISVMVLRATLTRQVTARQTRRTVNAQLIIESAMAQVNSSFASKTPEAYAELLHYCLLYCDAEKITGSNCVPSSPGVVNDYNRQIVEVPFAMGGKDEKYQVEVILTPQSTTWGSGCKARYIIHDADKI